MFSYLHCVVRIRENSVPALDDPLMISSLNSQLCELRIDYLIEDG